MLNADDLLYVYFTSLCHRPTGSCPSFRSTDRANWVMTAADVRLAAADSLQQAGDVLFDLRAIREGRVATMDEHRQLVWSYFVHLTRSQRLTAELGARSVLVA